MTRNQRVIRLAVTLAAAALFAVACGGPTTTAAPSTTGSVPGMVPSGGGATTMPPMSMPDSPTTGSAAQAPISANTVSITNFAFAPAAITVKVGTTVTWTNKDQDAHTVTAQDRTFSSSPLNTGGTYQFTFTKPGTYAYLCTIHPFMTATVVVTP
ncbi:MAG TPA: cupredoxin family copper-binding protein [Pseudonocardiaceae bacterium]|jgi:plastocyanin|nr:cupredoxin family copper-binding protein [Pseudonocardiaceae bacterium]